MPWCVLCLLGNMNLGIGGWQWKPTSNVVLYGQLTVSVSLFDHSLREREKEEDVMSHEQCSSRMRLDPTPTTSTLHLILLLLLLSLLQTLCRHFAQKHRTYKLINASIPMSFFSYFCILYLLNDIIVYYLLNPSFHCFKVFIRFYFYYSSYLQIINIFVYKAK